MNKVNEWASEHLDARNTEKYSKCIQKRDELLDENDKFGPAAGRLRECHVARMCIVQGEERTCPSMVLAVVEPSIA